MAEAAAPHPSTSLGTRGRTRQLTTSTVGFQSPGMTTGFSGGEPGHQRLVLCPLPLLRDSGSRLAASHRLPQPVQTRAASDLSRLSVLLSGHQASAPLPWGPESGMTQALTCATTHCRQPSPSPRPGRPGREPSATPHPPRQSGCASTLPHCTSPRPRYPAHKQPLPT